MLGDDVIDYKSPLLIWGRDTLVYFHPAVLLASGVISGQERCGTLL